nr:DMT family transporter [Nakamurella alba]
MTERTVQPQQSPQAPAGVGWQAWAAVLVTVIFWASAFVGIRSASEGLRPGPLALLRLLVAAVVLGVLVLVRREKLPRGRDWWLVIASGVLWFGVYNVALNAGEREVDAGTAAMLVNIGPLVIALLAGWLLREGFPRLLVAGLLVSFAGAVIVGISTSLHTSNGNSVLGVVLCLVAAVTYAAGVVAQKPLLARVSPLMVTFLGCALGAVVCLPFAPALVSDAGTATAGQLWTAVYLGIFPTALAFTTWAYALKRMPAGRLGATTYVVPAMVILMSWALLSEVPPWGAVIGGVVCLAGVAVGRISPRRKASGPG